MSEVHNNSASSISSVDEDLLKSVIAHYPHAVERTKTTETTERVGDNDTQHKWYCFRHN
jgi:hypothetical protein